MNILVHAFWWIYVHSFIGFIPKGGTAADNRIFTNMTIFNILPKSFQSSCVNLHSYQQCVRILLPPFLLHSVWQCFWSHFASGISIGCCSFAKSRLILCDPVDCSTPCSSLLHYLPEFAQIHVHWVGDGIQPSQYVNMVFYISLKTNDAKHLFVCVLKEFIFITSYSSLLPIVKLGCVSFITSL